MAAAPLRQPDPDPRPGRPRLAAVPHPAEMTRHDGVAEAVIEAPSEPTTEPEVDLAFENGLATVTVIGGAVGFTIVFALAAAGLYFISGAALLEAVAGAIFVGAFGGLGSGAMMAASLHKPRPRTVEAPRP